MEKHSMLIVRKNQYCENGHTAQSNFLIQCYPHQATKDFLHRNWGGNYLKFHMKPKKSPHSQDNPKQKNIYIYKAEGITQTSNYTIRLQ